MSVYVGVPAYGPIDPSFVRSLTCTAMLCTHLGVPFELDIVGNCSLIAKARCEIVTRFLASDHEALFFVDADLDWAPEDFYRILMAEPEIVGATYRAKTQQVRFLHWGEGETVNGLTSVELLPTGFMRLKRSAVQKLYDAAPKFDDGHAAVFNCGLRNGKYVGEDYAMCEDWRNMGGKLWLHPAPLKHCGRYEYT